MGNMMINHGVLGRPILRQTHLKVSRQIGQPCEDPLQRPKPNPEAWQISRLPLFAFCMRSAFFCFLSACKPSIGLWLLACLLARFILLPVLLLACCGTHTPLGPRDVRWRGRGGFSTAAANTCIPKTCCHWSADCTPPVDLSLLGDRQLPLHLCDAGWH